MREDVLRMTPFPFGNRSVEFTLTRLEAGKRAVFENPDHDFPRVFTYRRVADDRLQIELEGEQGGHPIALQLDLSRGNASSR